MLHFQLFVVAASFIVFGSASVVNDCPPALPRNKYLKVFGHKCYRFMVNQKKEFGDAEKFCKESGGDLVLVKNKKVNNFIVKTVKGFNNYYAKVWIGLKYDNEFKWEDGSSVGYANFGNKPTTYKYDCVFLDVHTGQWHTHDCDSTFQNFAKHYFVCEYPLQVPTSEPHHNIKTKQDCPANLSRDKYLQVHWHKCFRFVLQKADFKTFENAQRDCQDDGGNLALAKTYRKNLYIQRQLDHAYNFFHDVWIGLRYDDGPSEYKWVDGSLLTYDFDNFDWGEYEKPNDCVAIGPYGGWVVKNCDDQNKAKHAPRGYVCEYGPTSQHTTSAKRTSITSTASPTSSKHTNVTSTHRTRRWRTTARRVDVTTPTMPEMTTTNTNEHAMTSRTPKMTTNKKTTISRITDKPELTTADSLPHHVTTSIAQKMTTADSLPDQVTTSKATTMTTADSLPDQVTTSKATTMTTADSLPDQVTTSKATTMTTADSLPHQVTTSKATTMTTADSLPDQVNTSKAPTMTTADSLPHHVTTSKAPKMTTADRNTHVITSTIPEMNTTRRVTHMKTSKIPEISNTRAKTVIVSSTLPESTVTSWSTDATTPATPEITTIGITNSFKTSAKNPEIRTTTEENIFTVSKKLFNTTPKNLMENMTQESLAPKTTQNLELTTLKTKTTMSNTVTVPMKTTMTAPDGRKTCPPIICELDCGLDGYKMNEETGCMECKCNL